MNDGKILPTRPVTTWRGTTMSDQRTDDELPDHTATCTCCKRIYWPYRGDGGRCSICNAGVKRSDDGVA